MVVMLVTIGAIWPGALLASEVPAPQAPDVNERVNQALGPEGGDFSDAFAMECEALKRVRSDMGLSNVEIMVPFVRTVRQAERVIDMLAERGLKRGQDGLRIIMMCEVPSNAILADQFLAHFDGMSIGSNDLTDTASRAGSRTRATSS